LDVMWNLALRKYLETALPRIDRTNGQGGEKRE